MKIKIGKKGMMYLTGGAALAAIVAFSCGKVTESVVPDAKTEAIKSWTVTSSGDGVAISEAMSQTIADGATASFTVAINSGSYLTKGVVDGSCPAGTWNDMTYTTGAITADCTVKFVTASTSTAVSLTNNATHTTTQNVTMASVGEHQMLAPAAPAVTLAATTTGTTPSYRVSTTVGGNCTAGGWDTTGAYYITGALTGDCTVIFAINNPCATEIASSVATWTAVGTLLTSNLSYTGTGSSGGPTAGCTTSGCHATSTSKWAPGIAGTTAGSTKAVTSSELQTMYNFVYNGYVYNTSVGNPGTTNASSATLVVDYDPLESRIYRKTLPSFQGSAQMPKTIGTTPNSSSRALNENEQSLICNWIWHGAQNN